MLDMATAACLCDDIVSWEVSKLLLIGLGKILQVAKYFLANERKFFGIVDYKISLCIQLVVQMYCTLRDAHGYCSFILNTQYI